MKMLFACLSIVLTSLLLSNVVYAQVETDPSREKIDEAIMIHDQKIRDLNLIEQIRGDVEASYGIEVANDLHSLVRNEYNDPVYAIGDKYVCEVNNINRDTYVSDENVLRFFYHDCYNLSELNLK